jgi:hypothetical protein
MKTLPSYVPCSGYGYHGRAVYKDEQFKIYGADCGADCACDAVAVPADSKWSHIIDALIDDGVIPSSHQ